MRFKLKLTQGEASRVERAAKDLTSALAQLDTDLCQDIGIWFAVVQEDTAYLYSINDFDPEFFRSGQSWTNVPARLREWSETVTYEGVLAFLRDNCDDLDRFYRVVVEACQNVMGSHRMVMAFFTGLVSGAATASFGAVEVESWSHEIWAYNPGEQEMIRQEPFELWEDAVELQKI